MGGHHAHDGADVPKVAVSKMSAGIAVTLVSFMIATMSLLYLINSTDPQVKIMSRQTLSVCFAIFTAVNIEHLTTTVTHFIPDRVEGDFTVALHVIDFVTFLIWYLISVFWSLRARHQKQTLFAVLQAVPHASAFLLLISFEALAENCAEAAAGKKKERYGVGLLVYFFVIPGSFCVMRVNAMAANALINVWVKSDLPAYLDPIQEIRTGHRDSLGAMETVKTADEIPDHAHNLLHAIEELFEAHEEASAMVCGNLTKQFVLNVLAADHSVKLNYSHHKALTRRCVFVWKWAGYLVVWSIFIILAINWMKRTQITDEHGHAHATKNSEFLLYYAILTMAWNLCEFGFWLLQTFPILENSIMYMMVVRATGYTILFSVLLYVADKFADRFQSLEDFAQIGLIQVGGFTLGFVWEKAFGEAIHELDAIDGKTGDVTGFFVNLMILVVLVPGWVWFMVPKAMEPIPPRKVPREKRPVPKKWQRDRHRRVNAKSDTVAVQNIELSQRLSHAEQSMPAVQTNDVSQTLSGTEQNTATAQSIELSQNLTHTEQRASELRAQESVRGSYDATPTWNDRQQSLKW